MKLNILFDYQIFSIQRAGGISNYFYNLAENLLKQGTNVTIFSPLHRNQYLKLSKADIFGLNVNYIPGKLNFLINRINHFITKKYLKKNAKIDIVHETYFSHLYPERNKKKRICTIYDLIHEKFPSYFPNSREISKQKEKLILRSDHIICISENTKNDVINYFGVDPKKITVTLLASSLKNTNVDIFHKKLKKYILFVGSRKGYKNFKSLVCAYSKSHFLKNNYKIALFGGEKFGNEDLEVLKHFNLDLDNFWIIDEKKYSLDYIYSNVSLLVYPSIYEGFGLPILEAMSCGCPVLSSSGGSKIEVGGKHLYYYHPFDVDKLKNLIEKILSSESIQKSQILYGFERVKNFSWKKCALETQIVYSKVLTK